MPLLLGQVVVTTNLWSTLVDHAEEVAILRDIAEILERHRNGDWGELGEEDKVANDEAVVEGGRLLSSYSLHDRIVWVITEADRSVTTVLLPEDY
jgi:hypothetical protein